MDIFVLLATMLVCFFIGVPIAYSLALAAIAGAIAVYGLCLAAFGATGWREVVNGVGRSETGDLRP